MRSPQERLLAVFDFHEQWFTGPDFCGCMFINAAAEFGDTHCAMRQVAAEHKRAIADYLAGLCRACGYAKPEQVAAQLNLLLGGAIVTAQVVGQVENEGKDAGAAARLAKGMAGEVVRVAEGG